MNSTQLVGRLTRDPELRYTTSGKAVANANIAVNRTFKRDEADFINLVAWGKTAEVLANHVKKGSRIGVEGRIETGFYEKDGRRVYTTDVVVNQIHFLDSKNEGQGGQSNEQHTQQNDNFNYRDNDPFIEVDSDSLPF